MNKPKIDRPEESQPAHALWFDRKKYVTVNFMVQRPKDVQVDIQPDKMILCCKNDTDDVIYNELHFYDKVLIHDSRERVYDRTINLLLRKGKPDYAWPQLQKDPAKKWGTIFLTTLFANQVIPRQVPTPLLKNSWGTVAPSWISVDFDNWRDWEHEEDDGKEEYYRYMDMIKEMSQTNKGQTPDMGDLSDSD